METKKYTLRVTHFAPLTIEGAKGATQDLPCVNCYMSRSIELARPIGLFVLRAVAENNPHQVFYVLHAGPTDDDCWVSLLKITQHGKDAERSCWGTTVPIMELLSRVVEGDPLEIEVPVDQSGNAGVTLFEVNAYRRYFTNAHVHIPVDNKEAVERFMKSVTIHENHLELKDIYGPDDDPSTGDSMLDSLDREQPGGN